MAKWHQQHLQSKSFIDRPSFQKFFLSISQSIALLFSYLIIRSYSISLQIGKCDNRAKKKNTRKNKWEKRANTNSHKHTYFQARIQTYELRFSQNPFWFLFILSQHHTNAVHVYLYICVCSCMQNQMAKIFTLMWLVGAHCERILISTINLISLIACSQSI